MTTSLVLGVAGAGVGAYFGAPGLGYIIGSTIGSVVDAYSNNYSESAYHFGARLNDLRIQNSSYGTPIPIHFGRNRIAGSLIWAAPLAEHATSATHHRGGGKHGHASAVTETTYSYTASFAILLCRGTVSGFGRIWLDGTLFYDARGSSASSLYKGSSALGALTFYYGDENQSPDPTIEADKGHGNVPAYRGSAYLVFRELQIDTFGRRIPNVTVEVFRTGEPQNGKRFPDKQGDILWNSCDEDYQNILTAIQGGVLRVLNRKDGAIRLVDTNGQFIGFSKEDPLLDAVGRDQYSSCGCLNGQVLTINNSLGLFAFPLLGRKMDDGHYRIPQIVTQNGIDVLSIVPDKKQRVTGFVISADKTRALIVTERPSAASYQPGSWYLIYLRDDAVVVETSGDAQGLPEEMHCNFGIGDCRKDEVASAGMFDVTCSALENDYQHVWTTNGYQVWCCRIEPQGITCVFQSELNVSYCSPAIIADHGMCWIIAYDKVCVYTRLQIAATKDPLLAEVVSGICELSNLTAKDIDTSLLTGDLSGYTIGRQMSLRAALQPIMNAYFFDAVESDGKIKFVPRDSYPVVTLDENNLAAHAESEALPDLITLKRQQELELPKRVSVTYIAENADYQVGSQYAARSQVNSIGEVVIELPMVISDNQAAQIADMTLYQQWLGRETHQFTVGMEYLFLEPDDVVAIKIADTVFCSRLTSVEIGAPGILVLQGIAHDAAVYTSAAKGAVIAVTEQTLEPAGSTELRLLDIPLVRMSDDTPGFYVAACGHVKNWKGASLMQSSDGGAWNQIKVFTVPAVLGVATNVLHESLITVPDMENSICVTTLGGMELASISDARFWAGENLAVIGSEIIQFRDAVLQRNGSYKLSYLLRGRFGTEWAVKLHKPYEEFTLLTEDTIQRVITDANSINKTCLYQAVTLGTLLDEANEKQFTNQSVGLKPYAPVHLKATRDGNMNVTFSWIRCTRIGGEWRDNVDVPLGEAKEVYEVEIFNTKKVVRTLSIVVPFFMYSAEQQNTDKIVLGDPIHIKVYQLSALVGRGFPVEAYL